MNRPRAAARCLLPAACCLLLTAGALAAEDLSVLPAKIGATAPRDMMHAYWLQLLSEATDRHDAEYEKLKTPEQLLDYQQRMRHFFVAQLGGFPKRTPLNARVVGRMDRDGYRLEKIIFESRPRHYVTAVLYLPNAKPPYPGVLVPCGHSVDGKATDAHQRVCILLARSGMAALCYDPIDQGERYQLLDEKGKPRPEGLPRPLGAGGHSLLGVGSILLGRNTATFRVWDGMRAIDYLESRPEVDPKRIGCTGNSGGGTLTSYLMALDPRIACAAPSCYLTSFRRLMETLGSQDAEQNIHAQIAYGMDHAQFVLMRSPAPTLLCTATYDFFDIAGSWDTFRKAKRFYARQGFPERVDIVEADQKHGFSMQLRVAAVRWMRRWLLHKDDAITETDSPVLKESEIQCTPAGQVMLLPEARNVYDLNADLERQLAEVRKRFWQQTDKARALDEVRRITGIRKLSDLPQPRCEKVGTIVRAKYRIDKLILQPEPGIWLPALAFVPQTRSGQATLYLHASGKHADAAPGGPIEKLVEKGQLVLAVDLRGLGETYQGDDKFGPILGPDWRDAALAYMLDTSYLAKRAEDVLVCARFLVNYEADGEPQKVHLASIGLVGPPTLHAAALEPQLFTSVSLKNCLCCWSALVKTPMAVNQFINVVHGALRVYDLPDLVATMPKEKVAIIEPLDAIQKPIRNK